MIDHQRKDGKQAATVKSAGVHAISTLKKAKAKLAGAGDMTYNPELDKFSADNFIPEKQKKAETRLANSSLPPFK